MNGLLIRPDGCRDLQVTIEALSLDETLREGSAQRAIWLGPVLTVSEAACAQVGPELPKSLSNGVYADVIEAKIAHTRRVN